MQVAAGHTHSLVLTDGGADANTAMDDGTSPLYIACQNGHTEAARVLLNQGRAGFALHDRAAEEEDDTSSSGSEVRRKILPVLADSPQSRQV